MSDTLIQTPLNVNSAVTTPALKITLTPTQRNRVKEIAQAKSVEAMAPNEIALFGSERQQVFSKSLDSLLQHISKGSSPVLFQLFKELRNSPATTDMAKLETDIRNSQQAGWFSSMLEMAHLSNAADRLEKVNRKIGMALTSKTTSLLDLMQKMEGSVNIELQKLIADAKTLDVLATQFVINGEEYGVTVEAGRLLQDQANTRLEQYKTEAADGDLMKVNQYKDFKSKVELFQSRCMILETAYVQSFSSLEMVSLAKGASINTIADTANSVLSEFTSIKESLVQLSVSYQIQSVQAMGAARRDLRDKLASHSTNVLGNVAIAAAKAIGDNRLADAQKIATMVTSLKSIGASVETEHNNNIQKFAEARAKLAEAQSALSTINK